MTVESAKALSAFLADMDPWLTLGYRPSVLHRYLTRPDPALSRQAVFMKDSLAGVVCIRYPWLCGASLELLALLAGFQGKGAGAEILEWLEAQARRLAPNLWATVSSFNTEAQRFYARHGFETAAYLEDLIQSGFDEILLRKRLRSAAAS
jgi:ribosomal protein S18 acetylase RimI-like enzyme